LIQRIIEEEGIATVSVSLNLAITKKVKPPRALYPGFGSAILWARPIIRICNCGCSGTP